METRPPYQERLLEYEREKKALPPLTPRQYQEAVKKIARKWGI